MVAGNAAFRRTGQFCLSFGGAGLYPRRRSGHRPGTTAEPVGAGSAQPGHRVEDPGKPAGTRRRSRLAFAGAGSGYVAAGRCAEAAAPALARPVDNPDDCQPAGLVAAWSIRPCAIGTRIRRPVAAPEPIAAARLRTDPALAAQRRGGRHAGAGHQPVDSPFVVIALGTIDRRQPGNPRPGPVEHGWQLVLRLPVVRFLHPLRAEL
ncbi:hypothetical protein D3C80_928060 [compost metagenome]